MRLLLDTHTLVWWLLDRDQLSSTALSAIESVDNDVLVSVASAWEISIKVGLGRWPQAKALLDSFEKEVEASDFRLLPITVSHVRAAGTLPIRHRDPFDRLLLVQSEIEDARLVTCDSIFKDFVTNVVW